MGSQDDLNHMSFMDRQDGKIVKCVHCWNKVSRAHITLNDSACPRCDRYLNMDEDPYAEVATQSTDTENVSRHEGGQT